MLIFDHILRFKKNDWENLMLALFAHKKKKYPWYKNKIKIIFVRPKVDTVFIHLKNDLAQVLIAQIKKKKNILSSLVEKNCYLKLTQLKMVNI